MTTPLVRSAPNEFHDHPFARGYRWAVFAALLLLCGFIRLWDIGSKTMMHDELLFVYYAHAQLFLEWRYAYLPILHGPLMLHLQNLVFHLFGVSDYTVRLGTALLGVGGFFFIWKLRYWLGEWGTWFALFFYALSPGIAFFNRFLHMDALFLFNTLWIVASFANWWRTGKAAWGVSAIVAVTALFNTKASAIFVYFSIVSFLVFLVLHDIVSYFFEGKSPRYRTFLKRIPAFPSPWWFTAVFGIIIVLVLTQVFEGIRFDRDVVQAIGHDWALRDVRSIPLALGWMELTPETAPDAGAMREGGFWRRAYLLLFVGLLAGGALLKAAADRRLGHREFVADLWRLLHASRWYLLGAIAFSIVFYLAIYTTFFKFRLGPFEIYSKTWAYWGGQHEWGRISGPFYQHMLDILVYELPAVLVVLGAWFGGLFAVRWSRTIGFAYFLIAIAAGAFHVFMFRGLEFLPAGAVEPVPLNVPYLRRLVLLSIVAGLLLLAYPRLARVVVPASLAGLAAYSLVFFRSDFWRERFGAALYSDGEPLFYRGAVGNPLTLQRHLDTSFNFDGGYTLAIVLILIFFATIYTWQAISRGQRFHAFLVWWFVTALGVASYAREAVPQVGIHAMLPLILLAGSYVQQALQGRNLRRPAPAILTLILLLGIGGLWNVKTTFNLNFRNADDQRERMAYGPTSPDIKAAMEMIQQYHRIAPLARNEATNRHVFVEDYNNPQRHKEVRVFSKPLTAVVWSARWYLRDIGFTEGHDASRAIEEEWEFIFLREADRHRYPELEEKYNVVSGRGMSFWTPDPIPPEELLDIWKVWIPGHYRSGTEHQEDAERARRHWRLIWRYMLYRETFDGPRRAQPSISSREYHLFCWRKDLF